MRITREEVHAAADEINAKGIKPSTVKIREMLGKGSYSTIGKWLEEWEAPTAEEAEEQAPEAPEEISALCKKIWRASYSAAMEGLRQEMESLKREMAEKDEEIRSMAAAVEGLEAELEEKSKALDLAEYAQMKTEAEAEAEKSKREQAEARIFELERHLDSIGAEARAHQRRAEKAEEIAAAALIVKNQGKIRGVGGANPGEKEEAVGWPRGGAKKPKNGEKITPEEMERRGQRRIDQ